MENVIRRAAICLGAAIATLAFALPTYAQQHQGGEANLQLPDLTQVTFLDGISGYNLLLFGIIVCVLGLGFGLAIYMNLKRLPVHRAMREISELIYATCKTYLTTQGKFILILEAFIAVVIVLYFGVLLGFEPLRVAIILFFSLVGIAGSYGVAWFGIRVNTFANSRTAFASLEGKPFPLYAIPLKAGMSIGMMLISVELLIMLCILLFIPGSYAGPCFIGFAIGESLGAAALRIAGGIFTKIADIGSDLMKIVFKIKEDDARNPGVIADCTGDNAGDSVGPSADGFETYGVTGVALITFILLGCPKSNRSGAVAGLDLHHARDDDRRQCAFLLHQRCDREGALQECRFDEFRGAVDVARVDHFDCFRCDHFRGFVVDDSYAKRKPNAVVETRDHHLVRNHRGRAHT